MEWQVDITLRVQQDDYPDILRLLADLNERATDLETVHMRPHYSLGELRSGEITGNTHVSEALPPDVATTLRTKGIKTVGELISHTEKQILQLNMIGEKKLAKIKHELGEIGFSLAKEDS